MRRLLALSLLLSGCPDPVPTTTDPSAVGGAPPGGGAPGAPPPEGGGPPPAGGGRPAPTGFAVEPGQGVKLSGSVSDPGTATGTYRIDFLRAAEGAGFPELLHAMSMDKPGTWEVEAPKSAGKVHIVSYLDAGEDGPSSGEPAVLYANPVEIAEVPIADIALVLSDSPDLGDFAPRGGGGAPPGGEAGGAPPPGAPPPGEAPAPAPDGSAGAAPSPGGPPGPAPTDGAAPTEGAAPAEGAAAPASP